jgi:hypothetical protein
LINGQAYTARVTATDHVGLSTSASTTATTVDVTPPVIGELKASATYIGTQESSHRLVLDYGTALDNESGIVETICSIGSTAVHDQHS